jgi:hypothetical protein
MFLLRFLLALVISGAFCCRALAGLVITDAAVWNFDGTTPYNGTTPYAANSLNATVFNSGSMSVVHATQKNNQGAGAGDSGGVALQFTANNKPSKNVNNCYFTMTFTVAANVTDFNSITITYNYRATSSTRSGALNTWTLGGAASGSQTVNITQNGNWNTATVDFTGLTLAGGDTFTITDRLTGYANGAGNFAGFDNISFTVDPALPGGITPVPEPITYALPLFGLMFIGIAIGRRYWRAPASHAVVKLEPVEKPKEHKIRERHQMICH